MKPKFRPLACLCVTVALSAVSSLEAQTFTWTNLAGGSWDTAANWNTIPTFGPDVLLDFSTLNITANATTTLDGGRTAGTLKFGDVSTASNDWIVNTGTSGTLTLATTTGTPVIQVVNRTATINSVLAGTQGFEKTGTGTLLLGNNSNTFTGGVTVSDGTLRLGNLTATGTHAFSGTALTVASGATLSMGGSSGGTVTHTYNFGGQLGSTSDTVSANALQLNSGTLAFASSNSTTKAFNARIHNSGASTISYTSSNFTHNLNLNRAITGTGTLTFNWSGGATGRNVNIANLATTGTAHNLTGAVILNTTPGTANFNLNQGLGADSYEIRNAWQMNLNVDNGLNSASALTVTGASSIINFNNRGWTNASGVFTATNGTANIGRGVLNIASMSQAAGTINLSVGGVSDGAIITSGNASFTGGSLAVALEGSPVGKTFDLIRYGGTLTGAPAYSLTGDAGRLIASFNNGSGTNDKITLGFTGSVGNLVWGGNVDSNWNNNNTQNFTHGGSPDVFRSFDNVTFDGTAASFAPALVGTLTAGTVTFDGSSNYTLGGAGSLGGGTAIVKNGTHTLTIGNTTANTFTGDITVNGGILKAGMPTALGATTGDTTINAGGTLDVNGLNLGAEVIKIAGSGVGGSGAIINTGAQQINALRFVTLTGDATIGGSVRWDIRAGGTATLDLAGYKLTKTGDNYIAAVASNITSGDIDVNQGTFAISTSSTLQGTGTVTVNAGATLELGFGTVAANISRNITLNGGALVTAGAASAANSNISLSANSSVGGAGTFTLGGIISESGEAQTLSKIGTSSVILTNSSSNWAGGTIIENGTLQLNADDAAGSGTIKIGHTDSSAGTRSLTLNGVSISNDVETRIMTHTGFLGTITATGAAASTINGNVTIYPAIAGGPASSGGHLAGSGGGGDLRLMGQLNVAGGQTTIVHRTGNVEYGGGGNTAFTLQTTGTAKLAANNGISTLATAQLGVSGAGTLDLNGFNQTLAGVTKGANAATVTNNGATDSTLTLSSATDSTFSGVIQNGTTNKVSLIKDGSSTLTLSGNNTHSGATFVSAGTLLLTGQLANSSVSVGADATFGGTGTVSQNLDFHADAIFQISNPNNPLTVTGTITFGEGFGISNLSGINWDALDLDTPLTILSTTQTFTASNIGNFGLANAVAVGTGRSAYFQSGSLQVVVIPEPGVSLLGGLGALLLLRRRR